MDVTINKWMSSFHTMDNTLLKDHIANWEEEKEEEQKSEQTDTDEEEEEEEKEGEKRRLNGENLYDNSREAAKWQEIQMERVESESRVCYDQLFELHELFDVKQASSLSRSLSFCTLPYSPQNQIEGLDKTISRLLSLRESSGEEYRATRKERETRQKECCELFREFNRLVDKENRLNIQNFLTEKRLNIAKEIREANVGGYEKYEDINDEFDEFKRKIKEPKTNYIEKLNEKMKENWDEFQSEWWTWSAEVCRPPPPPPFCRTIEGPRVCGVASSLFFMNLSQRM